MKSVFSAFLGGTKSVEQYKQHATNHEADKPFTPADALTVSRPILGAYAARLLLGGERGATPYVMAMAATDMEGKLARLIDKLFPGSGWGSTAHGAPWDTYADTAAVLEVAGAALKAPRVSLPAKLAVATILGQETYKVGWALRKNSQFSKAAKEREAVEQEWAHLQADKRGIELQDSELPTFSRKLELPASGDGKAAMAEKLSGLVLAVATNDFDNRGMRAGLSAGALYFAGIGAWRGEKARAAYEPIANQMIQEHIAATEDILSFRAR